MESLEERRKGERQPEGQRSYTFRKSGRKRHLGCGNVARRWRPTTFWILTSYERAFERFGFFLARKPFIILVTSLVVLIASCLGFVRLRVEEPSEKWFTASDSQSRQNLHHAANLFPLLDARREELIMLPKHNQNVLNRDCLNDVVLVHKAVANITGYEEICARQMRTISKPNQTCAISSPLEVSGIQLENMENLYSILIREWKTPSVILSTGQTLNSSVKSMLGNFRYENKRGQLTAWADALRIIYFVRKPITKEETEKVLNFEKSFESLISSVSQRLKCVSTSYRTGKTASDVLEDVLQPKLMPLYLSALIITILLILVVYFSTSFLSCLAIVLLTFVSILLPLACTAGILSLTGISLLPTAALVPFLLLGKGTSDMLLILGEWKRNKNVPSLEHRASSCVAKAGFLVTSSSLSGMLLFGIAIRSSFAVVSNFFIIALLEFVVVTLAVTMLVVVSLLSFERQLKMINRFLLAKAEKSWEKNVIQKVKVKLAQVVKASPWILTSLGGKIISLFILTSIVSLCIISALRPSERAGNIESLYKNQNYKNFNEAREMFFDREIDTSIIFSGKLNYSQKAVQQKITAVCGSVGKSSYSQEVPTCWISAFKHWANLRNASCSGLQFFKSLRTFLTQGGNVRYQQDLLLTYASGFQISASRVHLQMRKSNHFQEDKRSLESLRNDLSGKSPLQALPVSEEFFRLDDLSFFENETVHVLVLASVVVFVFSFLSSVSFVVSSYLTVTFNLLVLETAGIMQACNIHLNLVSFLSSFAGVVVSLCYSIQVTHAFILSVKQEARHRMLDSLRYVGPPVLLAAFMSIAGSISLGFIFPSVKIIFFVLTPLIHVLGLLHALVLLPPLVSLTFEFLASFYPLDTIERNSLGGDYSTPSRTQTGEGRQCNPKRPGISIVGISCKFPGANNKDLFWDMLVKGKSPIGEFPRNRVEEHKTFHELYHPKRFVSGRLCATNGSYLEEIQKFDNTFFGISNQEARAMDPQQKILLPVVYEAIEDAGMRLEDLQKCRTGVFVGVMNLEFGALVTRQSNLKNVDQFSSTGITASILANRVSFCLNLTGPSLAVDTACSSSLTALKIACDNLHNGDCEVAIVCAPNIVLSHAMQMVSSMAGLLAPDGRCKSFDASGDGYGRGEGFAAVLLKLTEAALSDKDNIYCEIVACGMNNDGQNAVPMTAPSAKMQAELSRRVLEQSAMSPEDVDYFEAHGTGTAIGDVVEADSIADTYTRGTIQTRKLRVGSVKSNLNHTESTSGLAGLIKVALMIKQAMFVPTVNVRTLNPKLKLDEKGLVVQQTSENWYTAQGRARVGAVNSFGYGGSNVHVILREVKSEQSMRNDSNERLNYVLTISARSESALKQMARTYALWLRDNVDDKDRTLTANICYSLNERRSQLPHRVALSFGVSSDASQSLSAYANETVGWDKLVCYGEAISSDRKLVFMFGGQGSQWYGMGRQLFECEPVFREAIWKVSKTISSLGEKWSLVDEMMALEEVSRIAENKIAQPATFAVQYATAQLLMSWGIYPSAVLGHSLGEFAAASIAGIITVKEAVQLVLTRSTLQEKCPNNGGMAALGMSEEKTRDLLRNLKLDNTLEIAAVNDANSVTVTGDSESIRALGDHLAIHAGEVFWRVLGTKRAFHSVHMELIGKPFQDAMKRLCLKPRLSKLPMYSTVTGEVISGQQLNGDYWWRNIRCQVQFYPAMEHLLEDGHKQIIEISSQPILAHYVKQIALQKNLKEQERPMVLETLPRKRVSINNQHKCFLQSTVCKLYSLGYPIDWNRLQRNPSSKFIRLPTYPWKEERFWYKERPPQEMIQSLPFDRNVDEDKCSTEDLRTDSQLLVHPFLGKVMMTKPFSGLHCWDTEIDLHRIPCLKDHALIQGGTVMPGAAYLEMAFAMVKDKFVNMAGLELTDVKLSSLLTLPETQVRTLRLRLLRADNVNEAQFQIASLQDDHSENTLCSGNVTVDLLRKQKYMKRKVSNAVGPAVNELITNMENMPMERFKEVTETFGFNYGPAFSVIKQAWQRDNEGLCLVDISESENMQKKSEMYVIHPAILDACLQSCFVPLGASLTEDKSIVPVGFKTITVNDIPQTTQLFCYVTAKVPGFGVFDVILMSPAGDVLLTMDEFRVAELTSLPRQLPFSELAYEVQWRESHEPWRRDGRPDLTAIVLKDSSEMSSTLIDRLQAAEVRVIAVDPPNNGACDSKAEESITAAFSDAVGPNGKSNLRIINLWPVETSLLPNLFDVIEQAQSLAFNSSVFLTRLLKECLESRLFLVTLRTQMVTTCDRSVENGSIPWGATVWGLRRTANLEEFNLRVTTVDLSDNKGPHEMSLLVDEVLGESIEDEVAIRDGKRFINRLVRSQVPMKRCTAAYRSKEEKEATLYLATLPSSTQLCLRKQSSSKPSGSELKINVLYSWTPSGSLFDLLKPKGCVFVSGKVTELPEEGSRALKIGDVVCSVVPSGRVGSCITLKASHSFLKPASLTQEQAAYIPGCLAIVSHALQSVASGKECQTLLIHEGNRGPGPAAVLLATAAGHKVRCTISDTCSKSRKAILLEMGAEDVMYQRCSDLNGDSTDQFDAVLFFNQPSPNALQRSSRVLKKGGKLLILNSDFEGDIVLSANKHVIYEREDLADILLFPNVFQRLSLQGLEQLESRGILAKLLGLEVQPYDILTTVKAINQSGEFNPRAPVQETHSSSNFFSVHTFTSLGSTLPHLENIAVLPRGLDDCGLKEDRMYLVAGGMRGFGFEVARWMSENGAKTIGLLSRSKPSEATSREVSEMETKTGAKIHMFQVDISNQEQMDSFREKLQRLPSVAGIVHTAMVLRDAFIKDLTSFESFVEVMGPKIKGSFLLHKMSLNMDLDFFVMFSSMASIVGNMGQASYSAANAFQDALAGYRRHVLDLPGLAINWGPISGAGVLVRETGVAKLLTIAGLGFIQAKEGVKHMAKVLKENPDRCQISLFDTDWPRFLKSNTGLRQTSRLAVISAELDASDGQANVTESLAQRIVLEKDFDKRAELVREYVSVSISEWTGISSPSETDLNKSLYSFGVDSTAALTLKMQLESNLQVSFEVFYFMQPDTTPLKMSRDIAAKLNEQRLCLELRNGKSQSSDNPENEARQTQPDSEATLPPSPSGSHVQVVPLYNAAGTVMKFFCVHPSHRYAMSLVAISTGFQGQDLVSFYALGFTDPTVASEDWGGVRELATHYVQLVSKEQRHGPYFLGGYSYGGLLAYEMASILTEQKQRVEVVAMIDTFPWFPRSRTITTRLTSSNEAENAHQRSIKLQFENYLKKLAVDSLKMPGDEYETLREERNEDWIIDELQRRSLVLNVSFYDLRALRESLLRDHAVASRTHRQWQPPEIRYRGPLTFLKSEDTGLLPRFRSVDSAEEVWGGLVDGGTTVLVCPGDHYSMGEPPHAHVTGSILATALLFSYRILFPDFPRPPRNFSQRRAVEKLCSGVNVFLHSKKGNKKPHFGKLHFEEQKCRLLLLRSKDDNDENKKEKRKKIVDLKDLRMVQPGRFVSSSLKYANRVHRVGAYQSGNLGQIASVVTSRRVYNFEFTDVSDMKAFYHMIEAVFLITVTSV